MSEIIEYKTKNEDGTSITPEEIVRFCIEHNVYKINNIRNLWEYTDKKGNVEYSGVEEIDEYTRNGWRAEPTNRWEFDVN